jgi:hypothetical protein
MQKTEPKAYTERKRVENSSDSAPSEFAPNSTQPVEASNKSTQTHSSAKQKDALEQNEGTDSKRPAHPQHSAGQHAVGSFTGTAGADNPPKRSDSER